MNVTDAGPALKKLANCSTAVRLWLLCNDLQLNADKSEVVILGTAPQLRSAANILAVNVAGSRLQVAPKLKSLGVTIDSHLRFDCHAKEIARACNYHTRALRHMRTLLTNDLAQTVACSIVGSRLDYCNAMLYGAPAATCVRSGTAPLSRSTLHPVHHPIYYPIHTSIYYSHTLIIFHNNINSSKLL